MPMNPQGGGPWGGRGGGGGGRGPWGGGGGGSGGGSTPPPDIDEMVRKSQERLKSMLPGQGGGRRLLLILVGVAVVLWLATGFYRVNSDQQGVILRFGEWVATTGPGLHYHWPAPIETALTPQVTKVNRIQIGFHTVGSSERDVAEESLMLTGDENIVDIDFSVFWRIKDAGHYLFNIQNPEGTVKKAAESVMREVIGQTPIQVAFTEGRMEIAQRTRKLSQEILDSYQSGIEITQIQLLTVDPPEPVIDAFNDVQRAKADLERLRNQAEAYRNDIIPRARGESEKIIQEAKAYQEQEVNRAQGDAERFTQVLSAYSVAKDVTVKRMYFETMEKIMGRVNKVILDSGATAGGGSGGPEGVVPYLPLPEIAPKGARTSGGSQ